MARLIFFLFTLVRVLPGPSRIEPGIEGPRFSSRPNDSLPCGATLGLAWPLLAKLGLGRLPGDLHIERDGFSFYLPLATGLIVSIVLSLLLWLFRK